METVIIMVVIGLFLLWKLAGKGRSGGAIKGRQALFPEARNVISFDSEQVCMTQPNGEMHAVRWADLTMVGIRTTDEGPFVADVFWGLHGADRAPAVVYPQGATGESELLEEMQKRLAGFDNRKLIEAMGCTGNAFFLIWERKHAAV